MGSTTRDRKKFTKKVPKVSGKERVHADSRNTNNYNILLVAHKGIKIEGVACFKITNNQNGLVCRELNPYWMVVVCL